MSSTPMERLLTAREVAGMLGFSPNTILDWFEAGVLPGFKVGRAVRFRASELHVWLENHRCGPVPPCATAVDTLADVGTEA